MHYLLFYDYSPDYLERRGQFRGEHLKLAWAAAERGELVLGGVLTEPIDTGLLLFAGDSPEVVERFVAADPYMANGLVVSYRVRRWDTVVGELAANPVR
jgi:uncharacterized protein YciI